MDEDISELFRLHQRAAATAHHGGERILGDDDRQTGLLGEHAVDIAQQRATARHHQSFIGDVGAEFRRCLLERRLDGGDNAAKTFGQRLVDLLAGQNLRARHAVGNVAALDLHLAHLAAFPGGTDILFDQLGGGLADQDAVLATHEIDDGLVHLVAGHAQRVGVDDAAERDHADLGGTAADVEHHRAGRLENGQLGADGGGHRLLDQVNLARAGAHGRFADGAAFHLGRAAGHADDDARRRLQEAGFVHLADEILEHLAGDGEVGDYAVLHGPDRLDRAGRAPEHLLGLGADRQDGAAVARTVFVANGHHRGFIQDDTPIAHVDQGVGGTEVNGDIAGKKAAKLSKKHVGSDSRCWNSYG